MKWAIAAASLLIVANGMVLVPASRERSAPVSLTTIDVCQGDLVGGGGSDDPPALQLRIAPDSLSTPPGLDTAGLRALGFADASLAAIGRLRDSTFRWPAARPAWVRLRQRHDSLERFEVIGVAFRRQLLSQDSISLIVQGRVGFREQRDAPPPVSAGSAAGHDHTAMTRGYAPGIIYPAVIEVIPPLLHLDRRQIAALRSALPDGAGCSTQQRVQIATGVSGGIWVERLH